MTRLTTCFTEVFGPLSATELETLEYGQSPAWDSLAHIRLISEIEAVFGLQIEAEEIIRLKNLTQIETYLQRHSVHL